ncbi:MAG: hypothetical protein ACREQV_20425, partial [Candidatus Binatia bacterium]
MDSSRSFTPLLLSAHVPESIEAQWSCDLTAINQRQSFTLLATMNGSTGLHVEATTGRYQVLIADSLLVTAPVAGGRRPNDCLYKLNIDSSGEWRFVSTQGAVSSGRA